MSNDISITVRLPQELNTKLKSVSKAMGMTKTNFIRSAIHELLTDDSVVLDFSLDSADKNNRLVLNVNKFTYDILDNACKKYEKSMNAVIIAVSDLHSKQSSKWLQSLKM